MARALLNALIGEYRLVEPLGAGGMGEVYKAVHVHHGRVIAVKILFPELADGPALQRFYSEANIQASLRHPGIGDYFGFYEYQGRPCLLMEYVDGETLASMVQRRGSLPPEEAAAIVGEIAAVVAHFHSLGVVHRDLKTSNVKVNSAGRVKILDFGIARHQRSDRLTRVGAVIGTPEILSPEQVRGKEAGFETDVWQLGVLFYELLTGHVPFQASTTHEMYARILAAEFPPLRHVQPPVPPALERIVAHCLAKDIAKRYASGAEVYEALSSWKQPEIRANRRKITIVAGVACALVLLIGGGALVIRSSHDDSGGGKKTVTVETSELKTITVEAAGGPAQVFRDGKLVGTTPYPVKARPGENVNLVLKRRGYDDYPVQFDAQTERSTYTFSLDPRKEP